MRILVACALDPLALDQLSRDHEVECTTQPCAGELARRLRGQDVLVLRSGVSISRAILDAAPELRLIVRAGSGVDHIDREEVHQRGISLVRIPSPGARAAAELTFALMLALARHLIPMDGMLRRGRWAKHDFEGVLLAGRTLGVVGAGTVGSLVGQLGAAWGMRVLGCVRRRRSDTSTRLRRLGIEHASFDDVGAVLVNVAQAGVVDPLALYHALRDGKRLRGAALDVHENEGTGCLPPLRHLPNVILTPHVGTMTVDTQREIGAEVVRVVDDFVAEQSAPELALGA
jgi:phosphoglycerate dehydrogenase-like enzyme